jgi:hypothetical protein
LSKLERRGDAVGFYEAEARHDAKYGIIQDGHP